MHILADAGDACLQRLGVDLRARARQRHQLGTARIEGRRTAFVDFDMRLFIAENTLPRPYEMGEDDAVRRGAGRNPHHLARGFEQVRKGRVERLADRVAVIGGVDMIGGGKRLHYGGVDGGGIVRKKAHGGHDVALSAGCDVMLSRYL